MEPNPKPTEEVFALCGQLLEGRATPESQARLETLVRGNPDARRAYVEYMHQHASLHGAIGAQGELSLEALEAQRNIVPLPRTEPARFTRWQFAAAVAACLALAAVIFWPARRTTLDPVPTLAAVAPAFASLAETRNAKWGAGRLPTEDGSRLGAGRLRLAEGLATVVFDHGTRVTLEGPADLDLVSPQHCRLHHGVLIAKISPTSTGFVVETATARLTDHGTEFGVSVSAAGETQVLVMEGAVDLQHIASGKIQRLLAGSGSRVSTAQVDPVDAKTFEPQRFASPRSAPEITPGTVTITTALGRGKDAYVQTEPAHEHGSDVLLLVKNPRSESFCRKAYLGFDLAGLPVQRIREATLMLTMEPSGYGYASLTPVCTFSVYGLTDQTLDDWREYGLHWDTAPANLPGGAAVDLTKAVPLGSFDVPEGATTGEFAISGDELVKFLRQDTNGIASFIVVRDNQEVRAYSLVHGFASRRHPTGPPPTLRLALGETRTQ